MSVPQIPLALHYPTEASFERYLSAPEGMLQTLQHLATGTNTDWVYLAGLHSSGKTHLALAVCSAARAVQRQVAYLPLQAAANHLEQALEGLEAQPLVVLDGLEAIAGQRDNEVSLFNFHNRARSQGTSVLYTAEHMPDGLELVLPDLRSRLSQCIRFALQPLDDAGRAQALRNGAQQRGLVLEEAAIHWMLTHTGRDIASLMQLLDKLDRESLAAQRRITVPFLKAVLAADD